MAIIKSSTTPEWYKNQPSHNAIPQTTIIPTGVGTGTITTANWNNATINHKEYHIQGKMVVVSRSYDFAHRMNSTLDDDAYNDVIKKQLIQDMVNELWKNKHIEFTKTEDPRQHAYMYRARVCTVPDTQVRILREQGLPK